MCGQVGAGGCANRRSSRRYSQLQVIMIVERFICHVCGHVGTCARADAASAAAAATRRKCGAMAEGRTLKPNANRSGCARAGASPTQFRLLWPQNATLPAKTTDDVIRDYEGKREEEESERVVV